MRFFKIIFIYFILNILFFIGVKSLGAELDSSKWKIIQKTAIEHGANIAGFFNETINNGITVGNFGEAHYTNDGCQSWPLAVNNSSCLFGLEILDGENAWTCGTRSYIAYSNDGGQTWRGVTNFGDSEPNHCRYISFMDSKTGWVASPFKAALTTDGGENWISLNLPPEIAKIAAIDLHTLDEGYLVDENDNLYLTKDGGKTWCSQKLHFTNESFYPIYYSPSMAIRFTDTNHGVIISNRQKKKERMLMALVTNNGGLSWREEYIAAGSGSVFLSRDAKMLTAVNFAGTTMTVFQKP